MQGPAGPAERQRLRELLLQPPPQAARGLLGCHLVRRLGDGFVSGRIVEAFRLDNTTNGGAARRFRIGPDGYRQAEANARARGGTLAGFYHSHPNEAARPSAYDLEHAWPNFTYVIISVRAGTPGDITVWHLRDDRSGFDEGELIWPTGS